MPRRGGPCLAPPAVPRLRCRASLRGARARGCAWHPGSRAWHRPGTTRAACGSPPSFTRPLARWRPNGSWRGPCSPRTHHGSNPTRHARRRGHRQPLRLAEPRPCLRPERRRGLREVPRTPAEVQREVWNPDLCLLPHGDAPARHLQGHPGAEGLQRLLEGRELGLCLLVQSTDQRPRTGRHAHALAADPGRPPSARDHALHGHEPRPREGGPFAQGLALVELQALRLRQEERPHHRRARVPGPGCDRRRPSEGVSAPLCRPLLRASPRPTHTRFRRDPVHR